MFKSVSNSLILRGALALIVGIIALAWPNVTILALVILFAVYAFIDPGAWRSAGPARPCTPSCPRPHEGLAG
jgi:Short repeat of unknown function (DUF308)